MSLSQLRVQLVVAAGVIGTSLLVATFSGCQSSQGTQSQQSGPYGQYGQNQYGQQPTNSMASQQSPYGNSGGGNPNVLDPQNRQAFLNETQRLGGQPNLTPQDIVAMSRSGSSDQQIAIAIQQRGESLRSTPGVAQYLAQNNINPAVLGNASSIAPVSAQFPAQSYSTSPAAGYPNQSYPGQSNPTQVAMAQAYPSGAPTYPTGGQPFANQQVPGQPYPSGPYANQTYPGQTNPAFGGQPAMNGMSPPFASAGGAPAGGSPGGAPTASPFDNAPQNAGYPPVQADPGQVQSATMEGSQAMPSFDASAGGAPGQSWRPIPR